MWCRGVVVKRADSKQWGCQLDYSVRRNKNAVDGEGNGKPSHKIHSPRKTQSQLRAPSLVSATLEIEHAMKSVQQKI